ncbi:hypothetical protein [Nevskia ramosa]|uniref:hypothetical protein n=1 Tax=Nevskia ramosa TaxID=64002 RepID=UPI0003B545E6|nr:hypothetical protein [Nevskia ramosa]
MNANQLGFYTLLKKEVMRFWVRRDLFDVQWTSNPPNAAPLAAWLGTEPQAEASR